MNLRSPTDDLRPEGGLEYVKLFSGTEDMDAWAKRQLRNAGTESGPDTSHVSVTETE